MFSKKVKLRGVENTPIVFDPGPIIKKIGWGTGKRKCGLSILFIPKTKIK